MGKGKVKSKIKVKQKQAKKAKNIVKKAAKILPKTAKPAISSKSEQKTPQKSAFPIALAQINTTVGDIYENFRKVVAAIESAKQSGAQLIVFPQLTITGFPPKDLLTRPDFVDVNMQRFIEIVNATKGISCIFGFVNKENNNTFNAFACVRDQKILSIQNKVHLDGCLMGSSYFAAGANPDVVLLGNQRVGVVIAEHTEEEMTFELLAAKGVDFFVVLAASSYTLEKNTEQYISSLAKKYRVPIAYCNHVGAQDSFIFDGGSFVVDKNGLVVSRAKKFGADVLLVDVHKAGSSFIPPKDQGGELYNALTLGVRDYFAKAGYTKAVIGISGGLDSAVTAALAVHALGKENVIGLFLSSKMTSKESVTDAKRVFANLGLPFKALNIDSAVTLLCRANGYKYEKKNITLAEQNIQARVRAELLMSTANKNNALVLACSNKTDLAMGYFTLYGETAGALLPLGDLWKTQVYALAQYMNALSKQKSKTNVIPDSVLKKPATAELRAGQKDSDDMPPHDVLDKVLQLYIMHKKDIHEIVKLGFDGEMVRRVAFMMMKSEFKRQQTALPLRVSSCSFGPTWNYPIVSGWRG